MLFAGVGGESDEVVDDYVDRSAHGVAGEVGIIDGLRGDTLSGKCGVAVHEQREIFCLAAFTGAVLLGPGAPHRHRIYGFEVAGI